MKRNMNPTKTASKKSHRDELNDHKQNRSGRVVPKGKQSSYSNYDDDDFDPDAPEGDPLNSPDDALGLYLRQMGAIPLLNRDQELALAKKLEAERRRFRRAALSNWLTLSRVIETFRMVSDGQLALDPTIDVVSSLNLSRETILARMPFNMKTLNQLMAKSREEFQALMRTRSENGKSRVRQRLFRMLKKAIVLVEELSPRTELLEELVQELPVRLDIMNEVDAALSGCSRSAAGRQALQGHARHHAGVADHTGRPGPPVASSPQPPRSLPTGSPRFGGRQSASGRRHRQALPQSRSGLC